MSLRRALVSLVCALGLPCVACASHDAAAPAPGRDGGADPGAEAAIDAESLPLDAFVAEQMSVAKLPGLAAVVVRDGKVAWQGYYGFADLESKTPVRADTIFLLASISKTFTATAAMRAVEDGKLSLDDDVDRWLPGWALRNPKHADAPITLRMLLGHVSSINESYVRLFGLITPGDATQPIDAFLRDFLLPGGKSYAADVFADDVPGARYSYSQVGVAAVGEAIERATGAPFDRYVKEVIVTPLGMRDTSFRLADLDVARVAVPYTLLPSGPKRNEHWGAPFYPAATMHSTAVELAKFLVSFVRTPGVTSPRAISAASQEEMLKIQYPAANADGAVLWDWRTLDDGSRIVGHTGAAPGVSTTMFLRPSDGVCVITLTNSDVHIRVDLTHDEELAAYRAIEARLFRDAAKL